MRLLRSISAKTTAKCLLPGSIRNMGMVSSTGKVGRGRVVGRGTKRTKPLRNKDTDIRVRMCLCIGMYVTRVFIGLPADMTCLGELRCAATGQLSLTTAIMTTAEYYSWYLERSSLLLNDERATDMLLCDKHKEASTDSHASDTKKLTSSHE